MTFDYTQPRRRLRGALRKLENAPGPSLALDAAVFQVMPAAIAAPILFAPDRPHVTGSIDAAVALVRAVKPGWIWRLCTCSLSDDAWLIPDFNDPEHGQALRDRFPDEAKRDPVEWFGTDVDRRPSGQPALALCQSLILAQIAILDHEVRAHA